MTCVVSDPPPIELRPHRDGLTPGILTRAQSARNHFSCNVVSGRVGRGTLPTQKAGSAVHGTDGTSGRRSSEGASDRLGNLVQNGSESRIVPDVVRLGQGQRGFGIE